MSDQVTVLKHSSLLTKRWFLDQNGKPKQDAYGFAKTFQATVVDVADFNELSELLDILATEPHACVIRGAPVPGRDLSAIHRRKNARAGEPACFLEVPRRWGMLDVDLHDNDIPADYRTSEGCAAVVNTALGRLPMECRIAGVWWQLSSSAGFKAGVRIHLWYWLDRAVGEQEWQRWSELANEQVGKIIVDPAVFRTVQPHYTANPVFDGVVDPVSTRTGRIDGPALVLPRLAARAGAWRQKLLPLSSPTNEHLHGPIRDACAAYFCSDPTAAEHVLALALRQAVDHSLSLRGLTETKYNDEKLAEYIADGKAFAASRAAAGENLILGTDGAPKASVGNAYAILQSSPVWRELVAYNRRDGQVELMREPPWGGGGPRPWWDGDSVETAKWLGQEHRVAIDDAPVFRAVLTLSRLHSFDPVANQLNALVWDGVPRLDTWLLRWCGANDTRYNRKVCRIWPISAVARALSESPTGVQVDTVLVLQGSTGARKTSLFRVLAGGYYAGVIDDKDLIQKVHGPWIVEFPELGPFTRADVNKIKGFVDQKTDRYRVPYARIPETKPRSCVIVATTNETQWQEDATSARRFWPVDVGMIDLELATAERDQLWAEAVVAYRSGEAWWVEANDPDFMRAQEAQYARDPWEEAIYRGLEGGCNNFAGGATVTIPAKTTRVSTYEIFVAVFGDTRQSKRDQARIVKCMRKLGWTADEKGGFCKNHSSA